jgi:hypothetical protein
LNFQGKNFFTQNWCNITLSFYFKQFIMIMHILREKNIHLNLLNSNDISKLLMHVSSRNMFPTIRNLQIRVHVYCPHLSVVLFRWLPIMTLWRKDKQSWMLKSSELKWYLVDPLLKFSVKMFKMEVTEI